MQFPESAMVEDENIGSVLLSLHVVLLPIKIHKLKIDATVAVL